MAIILFAIHTMTKHSITVYLSQLKNKSKYAHTHSLMFPGHLFGRSTDYDRYIVFLLLYGFR